MEIQSGAEGEEGWQRSLWSYLGHCACSYVHRGWEQSAFWKEGCMKQLLCCVSLLTNARFKLCLSSSPVLFSGSHKWNIPKYFQASFSLLIQGAPQFLPQRNQRYLSWWQQTFNSLNRRRKTRGNFSWHKETWFFCSFKLIWSTRCEQASVLLSGQTGDRKVWTAEWVRPPNDQWVCGNGHPTPGYQVPSHRLRLSSHICKHMCLKGLPLKQNYNEFQNKKVAKFAWNDITFVVGVETKHRVKWWEDKNKILKASRRLAQLCSLHAPQTNMGGWVG